MQDLEFTIREGKLWMLQTYRNGRKRTGAAMSAHRHMECCSRA